MSTTPTTGATVTVRLSLNVNDETAAVLKALAARHGGTVTEEVRRAVAVYDFVQREVGTGQTMQLVSPSGHVTTVQLVG